jgi:hypothetical protein
MLRKLSGGKFSSIAEPFIVILEPRRVNKWVGVCRAGKFLQECDLWNRPLSFCEFTLDLIKRLYAARQWLERDGMRPLLVGRVFAHLAQEG